MPTDWSALKARVTNRLARHFFAVPFTMRNQRPMVSFTFDDVPASAATIGASILGEYQAKATFYVAGGLVGKWSGHWQEISGNETVDLHRRGHEIACHTFSHSRTTDLGRTELAAEIEANRRFLLTLDPSIRIENFAYPYGLGSLFRKRQLSTMFRSSRSIVPGVNSAVIDLQFLRATPLIDRHIDYDGIDRLFDETVTKNGWLIFYSHDVAAEPSPYGCTPSLLRHALDAATKRGVEIMTVAGALRAAGM